MRRRAWHSYQNTTYQKRRKSPETGNRRHALDLSAAIVVIAAIDPPLSLLTLIGEFPAIVIGPFALIGIVAVAAISFALIGVLAAILITMIDVDLTVDIVGAIMAMSQSVVQNNQRGCPGQKINHRIAVGLRRCGGETGGRKCGGGCRHDKSMCHDETHFLLSSLFMSGPVMPRTHTYIIWDVRPVRQ